METCQRDIHDKIIVQTNPMLSICLIIYSSGDMGEFLPEILENAVNTFFRYIAKYDEINEFVEISAYESYAKFVMLNEHERARALRLDDLRSGGNWNLPFAVAQTLKVLVDRTIYFDCIGIVHEKPLLIIVSDNQTSNEPNDYRDIDTYISEVNASKTDMYLPSVLFVSSKENNDFANHLPQIKFFKADKETLKECMIGIARACIENVLPKQILRNRTYIQRVRKGVV